MDVWGHCSPPLWLIGGGEILPAACCALTAVSGGLRSCFSQWGEPRKMSPLNNVTVSLYFSLVFTIIGPTAHVGMSKTPYKDLEGSNPAF